MGLTKGVAHWEIPNPTKRRHSDAGYQAPLAFEQAYETNGLPRVMRTLLAYSKPVGGKCMSNQRYSPEFKDEAVRQVVERGYKVTEVAERLGLLGKRG